MSLFLESLKWQVWSSDLLFTFAIFSFVLAIISFFVATALAIAINIAITFAIDPFLFALRAGGSVAVEDDEEREAEKPTRVVLTFQDAL